MLFTLKITNYQKAPTERKGLNFYASIIRF
nr:MAG TPA: hypothetical protein [Caudoviricetes sp.]